MKTIYSSRLVLEPCKVGDRDDFIALELDAEVMRFLNGGPVDRTKTHPDHVHFLMPRGDESYVWTARLTSDRRFVGWFSLFPQSRSIAEIGFRLSRCAWGGGLATEGGLEILRWGFAAGGFTKAVGTTMAVNTRSRRVMEKLGMKHVRTDHLTFAEPIPGSEEGDVWYELNHSDWKGSHASGILQA
jgi:RimJ/RimL family protein N-acetyltransferase